MNESEIKIKIFRKVDSLENAKLAQLYGMMLNFINGNDNIEEWNKLTFEEKQGIDNAILEIDSGRGIQHEKVMKKFRKKYLND